VRDLLEWSPVPRRLPRPAAVALLALGLLAAPLVPGAAERAGPLGPARAGAAGPAEAWHADYSVAPYGSLPHSSSPAIADVDGDGVVEIVVGHLDGKIRVFDAHGGFEVPWSLPGRGEARFETFFGTWPAPHLPAIAID